MHATQNARPITDVKNNYQLISATENSTHTILKFKRNLTTCDQEDWRITVSFLPTFIYGL